MAMMITHSVKLMEQICTWYENGVGLKVHWDIWNKRRLSACGDAYRKTFGVLSSRFKPFLTSKEEMKSYIKNMLYSVLVVTWENLDFQSRLEASVQGVYSGCAYPIPILCPELMDAEHNAWIQCDMAINEVSYSAPNFDNVVKCGAYCFKLTSCLQVLRWVEPTWGFYRQPSSTAHTYYDAMKHLSNYLDSKFSPSKPYITDLVC